MTGPVVGVLAVQGDFEKHIHAVRNAAPSARVVEVRTPEDLAGVERCVIPGGESTTVALLMQRFGLAEALQRRVAEGMPLWGTCMGMILMAREVEGRDQFTLGVLDVSVQRNAFGAQVHSFEAPIPMRGLDEPVTGVFIRAPVVTCVGPNVEVLAEYEGRIVAVRQGRMLGTSFHPELTGDDRVHRLFLEM